MSFPGSLQSVQPFMPNAPLPIMPASQALQPNPHRLNYTAPNNEVDCITCNQAAQALLSLSKAAFKEQNLAQGLSRNLSGVFAEKNSASAGLSNQRGGPVRERALARVRDRTACSYAPVQNTGEDRSSRSREGLSRWPLTFRIAAYVICKRFSDLLPDCYNKAHQKRIIQECFPSIPEGKAQPNKGDKKVYQAIYKQFLRVGNFLETKNEEIGDQITATKYVQKKSLEKIGSLDFVDDMAKKLDGYRKIYNPDSNDANHINSIDECLRGLIRDNLKAFVTKAIEFNSTAVGPYFTYNLGELKAELEKVSIAFD